MSHDTVTLAFGGDIMLGREVARCMREATVEQWLNGVSLAWANADCLIANLECPCVVDARPIDEGPFGRPSEIILHAPASRVGELAKAGVSAVTLANNHILDCGALGLSETVRALDEAGIYHAGAGLNLSEALEPAVWHAGGGTIGLVAFCYGPPAGRSSPGVAPCEASAMRRSLATARAAADLVVAALHTGLEYADVPTSKVQAQFRYLAEHGADIVIGHHPHVLQGLEYWKGVPIAYSLGDLIFDNSLSSVAQRNFARMAMGIYAPDEVNRDPTKFQRGAILRASFTDGAASCEWHPFRQDSLLRPQLTVGKEREEDLRRLHSLADALSDPLDGRRAVAEEVYQRVYWAARENLTLRELAKLAARPRWRYLTSGMQWLSRRIGRMIGETSARPVGRTRTLP
ncbi:CapA family protein [Candidatus Nitrospira bockiana]